MPTKKLRPTYTFDQDRLEALKAIVPEAFADGKVNWDTLKEVLGEHLEEEGPDAEHFGLTWPGKKAARRLASQPSAGTLRPAPGEGVNEDTTHHVFIEGDNLEVLKLLQKSYAGRVKAIFIDPPYNTGNDFIYHDNFRQPLVEYLKLTGQTDDAGHILSSNPKADGRFHSNWLNMMYPRLRLASQLLHDEGLIFVSIDDNEIANLLVSMDETFGEANRLAVIAWEKRFTRSNNARMFASIKDNIVVYRKGSELIYLREGRTDKSDSIYSNPDNDPRGDWTSVSYVNPATKEKRPKLVYPITNPFTGSEVNHPTHAWKYKPSQHELNVQENRLYWGKTGDFKYPRLKKFLSEVSDGMVPVDLWHHKETGTTDEGSRELEALLGPSIFDNPKPTRLVKRIAKIATQSTTGDIALDFFSGSCTTAQAVLGFHNHWNRKHR